MFLLHRTYSKDSNILGSYLAVLSIRSAKNFHECATKVGLHTPWSRVEKIYKKDKRLKVEIIDKKINI